jgi:hypothetical protein
MSVGRALRAALAAVVAWLVVLPWGGLADQYPYYAPMGAVVAVTTTVAGSLRETMSTAAAMSLGAVLAIITTPLPGLLQLAVVIAAGTYLAGWEKLGGSASWVPISGLFVLLFGQDHPWGFPAAYIGLTTVGAVIGALVNLLWPPLPLHDARRAALELQQALCEQLHVLADALSQETLPTAEEWQERVHDLAPALGRMRELVSLAADARRANWRAARWEKYGDDEERRARALDALAFLVEDITWFLSDRENADREDVAIGPALRPLTAEVLLRVADVLGTMDEHEVDEEKLQDAQDALERLVAAIRDARTESDDDMMAASGVVSTVRRTLDTLH